MDYIPRGEIEVLPQTRGRQDRDQQRSDYSRHFPRENKIYAAESHVPLCVRKYNDRLV